jgi:hypothetical protein
MLGDINLDAVGLCGKVCFVARDTLFAVCRISRESVLSFVLVKVLGHIPKVHVPIL